MALLLAVSGSSSWADDTAPNQTSAPTAVAAKPSRAELAMFAMGLIGAVYRPGGDDPKQGMDCSGFVRYVYQEVAGLTLPHNAAAISKISTVISKADLKPGDLVFFKTVKKAFSHVGIYLGDNQFVHASSSETGVVMVSRLDESYWSRHYDGARRVLNSSHADNAGSAATLSPASLDSIIADPIASFAH